MTVPARGGLGGVGGMESPGYLSPRRLLMSQTLRGSRVDSLSPHGPTYQPPSPFRALQKEPGPQNAALPKPWAGGARLPLPQRAAWGTSATGPRAGQSPPSLSFPIWALARVITPKMHRTLSVQQVRSGGAPHSPWGLRLHDMC